MDSLSSAIRVADALAKVCEQPAKYRALLDVSARPLVDDVLAAGQENSGDGVQVALDALHEALRQAGLREGIYGHSDRGVDPVLIGAPIVPSPPETIFLCPGRRCSRFWLPPQEGVRGQPPTCEVFKVQLRERGL